MNDIEEIKERNRRVELDKAWETSWTRRIAIALITYIIAGLWLGVINVRDPWMSAFVPTVGYLLSTLSLGFIKKMWVHKRH